MTSLRVLITNHALECRAGSELYVRDLAGALLARGHRPVAYSTRLGEVADEIRRLSVPVIDDLDRLGEAPDLIHGQHHIEAMTAILRFPDVPAVYFCHGWLPWEETPPRFPRILRYVAVDDTCRDRLVAETGIPPGQVEVVLNFVDLQRFARRSALPSRPHRALVFSNSAQEASYLPEVRRACKELGLSLDVVGLASGNPCPRPEEILGGYDLIFAKGRSALEAMASGAAVVICDANGCGPLVRPDNFDRLRRLNFGIRCLASPVKAERLIQEIGYYSPSAADEVTSRLRAEAALDQTVKQIEAIYARLLGEHTTTPRPSVAEQAQAAAAYLRQASPSFQMHSRLHYWQENEQLHSQLHQRELALERATREAGELRSEVERLDCQQRLKMEQAADEAKRLLSLLGQQEQTLVEAVNTAERFRAEAERWYTRTQELDAMVDGLHQSLTMRLRAWAWKVPLLARLGRSALRGARATWRGAHRLMAQLGA